MINVYSDKYQSALNYLKDIEANIKNVLTIAGDFNIRDRDCDPSYLFHSFYSNSLMEIANSLSSPIHQVSTCYANNHNDSNSVIDLLFL